MRPPVSIHMMPDFSAYDSCNAQSVSGVNSGTVQPVGDPGFYSHKSLKRKRSESTDDSDDGEDRDYNFHFTRNSSFGPPCPVAESGYVLSKSDERGHAAKRARLANDFAELRLRGQSISPNSSVNPGLLPSWAPAPAPVVDERSPPLPPAPAPVEIDLMDAYADVQPRQAPRGASFASTPPDIDIRSASILRGEVEEVVSPGVQAERSRNKTTTDGGEHDTKMHGTSSYEPEKDRASLYFRPSPIGIHADIATGIVITDLDDFSDSDGESPSTDSPFTPTSAPYKISGAYLSQFGHIPRMEFGFEDLGDAGNKQALVAYRPLVQTINSVPPRPKVFRGYIEEVEDSQFGSPTTMQGAGADGFVVEPYPEDAMDIDME